MARASSALIFVSACCTELMSEWIMRYFSLAEAALIHGRRSVEPQLKAYHFCVVVRETLSPIYGLTERLLQPVDSSHPQLSDFVPHPGR